MNIGIDGRLLSDKITGINRYLLNVLNYLPLFDNRNNYYLFLYQNINYKNNFYSNSVVARPKHLRQIQEHYWLNFKLPRHLENLKVNIFFTPYILVPFKKANCRNVIVIHDVMTKSCPQFFTKYYRSYLDIVVPQAIKRSDAIVTVSESARSDIIKYYNVLESKVHFMHLWTDDKYKPLEINESERSEIAKKYKLPEKFILYVGAIEERKNIWGILKISDILKKRGINIRFVLIGVKGFGFDYLENEIQKRKDSILHINYVDEGDLSKIYNLAEIFLFPSFYEGFGLPPLEAMKCGLPVLASRNSSLIEVVGEGGLLFNEIDYDSYADKIELLLQNREFYLSMKKRALKQAEKFLPDNSIPKLINLFESFQRDR